MGFRRYVAPTAREALERIRKELGADAVILSNRRAGPNRVEIIAAAQGQMDALVDDFVPADVPAALLAPAVRKPTRPANAAPGVAPAQARRTAPESFQEFIRRQSAEPAIRNEGLDMYRQVAREVDEPAQTVTLARNPALRAQAPRTAPTAVQVMTPAPLAPPGRARQSALEEPPQPAVFRRRPSRMAPMAETPAAMAAAAATLPVQAAPQAVAEAQPTTAVAQPMPVVAQPNAAVAQPLLAVAQPIASVLQPVAAVVQPAVEPAVTAQLPVAPLPPSAQQQAIVPAAAPPAVPATTPDRMPEAPLLQGIAAIAPLPDSRLMAELQSLRSTLNDRISRLEVRLAQAEPAVAEAVAVPASAAVGGAAAEAGVLAAAPAERSGESRQTPVRRQVMTRLIMSGFSPQLSRRVGDAAPATLDPKGTDAWLQQIIGQYVRCPGDADNPLLTPGAVALVGPTGVGKTTTIAKIAARFVVRHGAAALALVTLDSYRMGAHEQLRGYGRILGVPVHTAHDAGSLRELLASLHGRRQVLIDTCGMSQRDPRLGEMLAMIEEVRFEDRPVKRVLLVNAASHAETLDEVARGWRVESAHGAILTKIDEAARIGGALDALMRFQTPLLGLTNGQRVPEDWHPGNPPLLAHIALKPFGAAFALDSDELQALARTGAFVA